MSSPSSAPPAARPAWAADDRGPHVLIAASFMAVASLSFIVVRLLTRIPWRRLLWFDDHLNVLSASFGLAHTIVAMVAVRNGMGKRDPDQHHHRTGLRAVSSLHVLLLIWHFRLTQSLALGFLCHKRPADVDIGHRTAQCGPAAAQNHHHQRSQTETSASHSATSTRCANHRLGCLRGGCLLLASRTRHF
ncbi:hypothetical protein ANO11243_050250 [Dothideomycetidae sp. 11243]|nr:hypothetical protein ANO11243_050250 [fungal sp. No.11243]